MNDNNNNNNNSNLPKQPANPETAKPTANQPRRSPFNKKAPTAQKTQDKKTTPKNITEQSRPDLVNQLVGSGGGTPTKTAPAKKTGTSAPKRPNHANQTKPANKPAGVTKSGHTAPFPAKKTNSRPYSKKSGQPLRIIPLGGLGEIGKNITYYEYENDAFLVDCGLAFPDDSMLGVDLVIPDFNYVIANKSKIRALFVTHGHEDHIGSIPYLLKDFNVPIYATRLTIGLIEGKLKEHGLLAKAKLHTVKAGDVIKASPKLSVEFINVNHSIPDACSLAIHTPVGIVIQTGDFKVDYTPIGGSVIDLARFGELGRQGVLLLLSDSTNSDHPGSTASERTVGESLDKLFTGAADKRILVATFSSNVHRVQQIIDAAVKYGRKVAVSGRSMENVVAKAIELGYLKVPENILVDIDAAERIPSEEMVVITTGSQGEPMSALSRMAAGDHRKITITSHDCIIISATPIPGNEKSVTNVVNALLKTGAQVVYEKMYEIHVSGHACQDEQKLMLALTKPKFFMPVHGEYKHLRKHADTGISMGIPESNIIIGNIGDVVELTPNKIAITETVPAGRMLVDGIGVGDVGSIVLRDRKHLSEDGLIVVIATIDRKTGKILAGPDIVSRGFVYVRESEDMISSARDIARKSITTALAKGTKEWGALKNIVRDDVSNYLWRLTKRSPMILPVIQEV